MEQPGAKKRRGRSVGPAAHEKTTSSRWAVARVAVVGSLVVQTSTPGSDTSLCAGHGQDNRVSNVSTHVQVRNRTVCRVSTSARLRLEIENCNSTASFVSTTDTRPSSRSHTGGNSRLCRRSAEALRRRADPNSRNAESGRWSLAESVGDKMPDKRKYLVRTWSVQRELPSFVPEKETPQGMHTRRLYAFTHTNRV